MENEKKTALVTGASSGIGLALSKELARRGYPLFIVSNEEEKLAEAAGEIGRTYGVKVMYLFMDLAQKDSAQKLFDYCEANAITVGILINNAGIFFFRDVALTDPSLVETVLNLHVQTPAMLCRLFAEKMMRDHAQDHRENYIMNMASIAAWMMMPGITLYNSTKSFLRCYSRALRHETFEKGISITTVCPGAVATDLYKLSPRYRELGVRLGIMITPEHLARRAIGRMFKKRAEYIPGFLLNRFFIFAVNAMPGILVRYIMKKVNKT